MTLPLNSIHLGDNLELMQEIESESIDLIYADPPFHSQVDYMTREGGLAFSDKWGSREEYVTFMYLCLYEMHRVLKDTGSIYVHCDPSISPYLRMNLDYTFRAKNFRNEIIWTYPPTGQNPKRGFPRKHDTILFYAKSPNNYFNQPYTEMSSATRKTFNKTDEDGRLYSGAHGGRTYLDESLGRAVPDWWTDIGAGSHMRKSEKTGYPTQKPIKLLKRIINASTRPNDTVLDPFCGSGTTLRAAKDLGRNYIGLDKSITAYEIAKDRLEHKCSCGRSMIEYWGYRDMQTANYSCKTCHRGSKYCQCIPITDKEYSCELETLSEKKRCTC